MEKNKGKVQLSDELLDPISGGYEEEGSEEVTGGMIEICRYCGRPIRNGNLMSATEISWIMTKTAMS